MSCRFAIWSEAHQAPIFSSDCLEEALRVWEECGCLYPYEKLIMIKGKGRAMVLAGRRTGRLLQEGEFVRALLEEIEVLEKEGLYGFTVRRYL